MGRRSETANGGRRRVSQADVARAAGVSTGIVSSVINSRDYGSIRVSDATRTRVLAAVRELGYVPNLAARNLARGSNRLLGVFTYLPLFPLQSRNFYHDFLVGVEEAAEVDGYNLLLATGAKNADAERSVYANGVNNLQLADGAVLLGSGENVDELARLTSDGFPFVFIGQREPAGVELSYVAADYRGGTAAIVRSLHQQGHRRIAMLRDAGEGEPVPGRRPGFLAGCAELGIGTDGAMITFETGPDDRDLVRLRSAAAVVEHLRRRRFSAVVVETTADAVEVWAAARAAGLSVPGDLSIVGLGVSAEDIDHPGLAELSIPRREMGQESVRLLLGLLDGSATGPARRTLPCGLDRGTTMGPPT